LTARPPGSDATLFQVLYWVFLQVTTSSFYPLILANLREGRANSQAPRRALSGRAAVAQTPA